MKFVSYFLFLFVISASGTNTPLTLVKQWPGGFEASFTVRADQRLDGWSVHVIFSEPVEAVQVWKGKAVAMNMGSKTEYVIQNRTFDGELQPGQDIIVELQAYTDTQTDTPGSYYVEGFNGTQTVPVTNPPSTNDGYKMKYDYREAMRLSVLFYDAQRSGKLPPNNPIPWRGDAHVNDSDNGHDLSGGWYLAGDHLKITLPLAQAVTMLEWGFLRFRSGYDSAGQTAMMCDMIQWPLEYLLKLWIPAEQTLYIQVGASNLDHGYWGRPEDMTRDRPSYKVNATCPGSDVAGSVVSALAAGSMVFDELCSNATFSGELKRAATSLYEFATQHRGIATKCVGNQLGLLGRYTSADDRDELATAGAWMYKVFKEDRYLSDAESYDTSGVAWSLSWHDQGPETDLLLWELTKDDKYKSDLVSFINGWMPDGTVPQTGCGLAFRDRWGSLRYAANVAFLALVAADDGLYPEEYKTWALSQINYILGDNNYNMSYEIAFGEHYPLNYHHRGSSCPTNNKTCNSGLPGNNKNLLKGGLVGGPDINDHYRDNRNWYTQTEVDIGYNSGFQGALAGLVHFAMADKLPSPPTPLC